MFNKRMSLKGFIGPLGDDIPTLLAVMLAISLFFSALVFSYSAYNDKVNSFNKMKGSIDITRIITQDGLITENLIDLKAKAKTTAMSYGVDFAMEYSDGSQSASDSAGKYCKDHPEWFKFRYLVAVTNPNNLDAIELKILEVCVG